MGISNCRVFETSVDYITATSAERESIDCLSQYAAGWLRSEENAGCMLNAFYLQGYSGFSCGSVQAGSKGGSFLVRLSSYQASQHWRTVLEYATNVSRLDLQSTLQFKVDQPRFAESCERRARFYAKEHNVRREVELRRNSKKGNTLYVGNRLSDRFIRIYDKRKESKLEHYERCWRGEIELKRALANDQAIMLATSEDENADISRLVLKAMLRVGIPWQGAEGKALACALRQRSRGSTDRRLAWLRTQVRPSVAQLLEILPRAEVLEALGLDD